MSQHVFDSRSLDFADGVLAATDGAGVDVVLNSLSGDFIPRSVDVLAPGGRFLEIGRRDVWDADAVAAERPDVAYHIVFLGDLRVGDPPAIQAMLSDLMRPLRVAASCRRCRAPRFESDDAADAFRYMAQARHTGKIVVRQPVRRRAGRARRHLPRHRRPGGIGLLVARHLAEQGAAAARAGRPTRSRIGRDGAIAAIRALGAEVEVVEADVADGGPAGRALDAVRPGMPPLRGVVHAAGVTADAVLDDQTWDHVAAVLAPKLAGAGLLDELTARPSARLVRADVAGAARSSASRARPTTPRPTRSSTRFASARARRRPAHDSRSAGARGTVSA